MHGWIISYDTIRIMIYILTHTHIYRYRYSHRQTDRHPRLPPSLPSLRTNQPTNPSSQITKPPTLTASSTMSHVQAAPARRTPLPKKKGGGGGGGRQENFPNPEQSYKAQQAAASQQQRSVDRCLPSSSPFSSPLNKTRQDDDSIAIA